MDRSYRDVGRSSLMGDYHDDYRGYSRQGSSGYLDREPPVRDSYMGSSPAGYRSARSAYSSGGGGSLDRDIVESLLQQRALQQQLNLRESQLALANSMLQQQQQQGFLHKRRMDPRDRMARDDFKRPRMMDPRSKHRRPSGGRDSSAGSRGSRGSSSHRRNVSSPGAHGRGPSDRSRSPRESYDPEKPTADEGEGKNRCRSCNVDCKDGEELQKHLTSTEHKDRVEHLRNKNNKRHCNICDVELKVSFLQHQRMTFHKKRRIQVTKGCAWCKVTSFKNFTEVLEHRATEKHIKNQKLYDKRNRDSDRSGSESRRGNGSHRKREPIRVELPPELEKFDDKVVTGQVCVVAVTGWFCKVCNKFYNNETAAKETHCMSELHFNNYKKFMYAKLRAKAEAERDAKEKAEEEEERKKKEAEEKEKKEDGADDDTEKPAEEENEEGEQEGEEEEMEGVENDGGEEEGGEGGEGGEEEGGEAMMEEAEDDCGDEEGVATAEDGLCEPSAAEGEEDPSGAGEAEIAEGASQEEEPAAGEEAIEAEGGEEEEEEEEPEETRKVTRGSPAKGRGGRGANRARRGRRVAK